ncbi:hypothetical protein GCM10023161_31950 [Mycobacterium paraffinicum]|uniref:Uncharacterized protein n=1 Tax=Mycobacterium paraffinicum TaxID=53378 RepID=A0ABP8RRA7_9MYCO
MSGWVVLLIGTVLLLDTPVAEGTNDGRRATVTFRGCSECDAKVRGDSAATATATARGAAQIDCAALGEQGLNAG